MKKLNQEKQIDENLINLVYKHKDNSKKIIDPFKLSSFTNAKQLQSHTSTSRQVEVCRYGKGQIFGEEEFVAKGGVAETNSERTVALIQKKILKPGTYSVICDSVDGELFCVRASDFQKKVR